MQIELSAEEVGFLRQALDNYMPELDYELARVKRPRDRHGLVLLAQALRRVRNRLDEVTLTSGTDLAGAVP
ncbi:MAG TPA: hypothetical protein VH877_16130 [Polyangia bacterium]|jgi:hypothetical protein|nr:hypothetical protein [Polyangia bacterium]